MMKFEKEPLHVPVLKQEILDISSQIQPLTLLDCTFGRGGHSLGFLERFPSIKILALDKDKQACDYALTLPSEVKARLDIAKACFEKFPEDVPQSLVKKFDVILMDLGVSSPQLNDPKRGFSFYGKGPLDMRMDKDQDKTAEDIINSYSKSELNDIFQKYGEIKHPYKVVDVIFKERKNTRISDTDHLARLIGQHATSYPRGRHPATPYFMALRIEVNQELQALEHIPQLFSFLNEGAYMFVISFHSLEDRIVKNKFKEFKKQGLGVPLNKKIIRPSKEEIRLNPRSRSAKLRVFEKRAL